MAGQQASRARIAEAIQGLSRVDVPAELDGRVVAALFAGERQSRAVRSVRELDPVPIGNRFLVYALFPEVNVSARIQWTPGKDM